MNPVGGSILGQASAQTRSTPTPKFHFYAKDSQLFIHLSNSSDEHAFDRWKTCLEDGNTLACAKLTEIECSTLLSYRLILSCDMFFTDAIWVVFSL